MLRVNTMLLPSSLEGFGLFTCGHIKKGTVTWERDSEDFSFTMEGYLQRFSAEVREYKKEQTEAHSYFDETVGLWIYCVDEQKYINHSEDPNIISTPHQDIAARDIDSGEEMTCDYEAYESNWFLRRNLKREDFVPYVKDDVRRIYVMPPLIRPQKD